MLNSAEHEISTAHKCQDRIFKFNQQSQSFILAFMSWINFMLRRVEHEIDILKARSDTIRLAQSERLAEPLHLGNATNSKSTDLCECAS